MRADDISNIIIMKRPMDDGRVRVTAQLSDGTDIAHSFYGLVDGQLRPTMSWISNGYRGGPLQAKMDAAADGDGELAEVSIGQLAKAAAVGAGVLGGTYMAQPSQPPVDQPKMAAVSQAVPRDKSPAIATVDDVIKGPDAPVPAAAKVKPIDTEHKVTMFLDEIVPLVKAENAKLIRDRQAVIRMVSKIHRGKGLSPEESQWLQGMMDRYGTRDPMELLNKVDIVPNSMAVAQAAVESGWGQDALAQKANVIFGQKTWGKDAGVEGPEGERYAAFNSPADSVRAYMQNLNTHPAYEKFRDTRAGLRAKNKPVTGQALLPTITKYSTLGKDYVSKVAKVIKGRNLHQLDR